MKQGREDVDVVLRESEGGGGRRLHLAGWAVPADDLATLPDVVRLLLEASAAAAPGVSPRRHADEGALRPWGGVDAAAQGLVHGIQHEQTSHYCCADSPVLMLAWPGGDAPPPEEVASRVRERLAGHVEQPRHERALRHADESEPALMRALNGLGLGWLGGLVPEHEPVDVHRALHDETRAVLSLECSLHFQQGHHSLDACWLGDDATLVSLRARLEERLRALGPRVKVRG